MDRPSTGSPWPCVRWASGCCGACCSRPWAMHCARARFGLARRCNRHRCTPRAMDCVCDCRPVCRPGRRAVCVQQRRRGARCPVGHKVRRWSGHGDAGRRADSGRPVVGAAAFTWLHDTVARNTEYWRALLGAIMLILVLLTPQGLAGYAQLLWARLRPAQAQGEAS